MLAFLQKAKKALADECDKQIAFMQAREERDAKESLHKALLEAFPEKEIRARNRIIREYNEFITSLLNPAILEQLLQQHAAKVPASEPPAPPPSAQHTYQFWHTNRTAIPLEELILQVLNESDAWNEASEDEALAGDEAVYRSLKSPQKK